ALAALLAEEDWPAVLEAVGAAPELLDARFGWAEQTVLHRAVIAGERLVVEALLDLGADVMARDGADNATPLHWAADRGDLGVAKLLVERGADPADRDDLHGWGPLGWATLGELREDVARWLLRSGAPPRIFPLIALDDGSALSALLEATPAAIDERLSRWEHYECPLHYAVGQGSVEAVETLLDAGADAEALDWLGLSPLAVATFRGRPDLVARLEATGVGDDLSAALARGDLEAAAVALEGEPGALAPKARYGRLLMYAAENDHAEAVRWLLENGANPDTVQDWWDNRLTALHPAASHGALSAVVALVEAGADTTVRDHQFDATPLEWARHFECEAVVEFLSEVTPADETVDLTGLKIPQFDLTGAEFGDDESDSNEESEDQNDDAGEG
ncbi:MAG: ankyrin repeat domain-containing protein, partial [Gemmatimonadota bacterium]|nr:ankyrin repeat domain-containing protein [Gemmatimonadota bacterium]